MANQFKNPNWVSMEVLRMLLNQKQVAEAFNTDWDKDFKQEFAPGSQIQIKLPQRFTVSDGMGYAPQAINRITTQVNLDQWMQIAFEWDDYERAVNLERSESELREQYWKPAADQLGQELDSRCAQFAYQNASNVVGVLGTDPTAVTPFYQARQRMAEKACPAGKRYLNISSSMMASLGANITTFFQPADELISMFKEGSLGRIANFNVFESNSLYSHTAGTWQSTVSVNGANQTGTSLNINCTSGDTFKKGDKFNINSVNAVNPVTRRIAGKATLQQFTVTADFTATGSTGTIQILPAIFNPGSQYQNIDVALTDTAALTLWPGTSSPNGKVGTVGLALSKYAFALVGAKLYKPTSVEKSGEAQDEQTGLAVRIVKAWDPVRSMNVHRMDMLFGLGNLYQDNGAVCLAGA